MRTATPNDVYTQQGAKPACQEDITVNFSHLLLAQLPGTQFTHSKLPNPHARKTSPYIFRSSYWHSYPEHSLHTASCHDQARRNPFWRLPVPWQRRPGAPQPLLEAPSTAPATQTEAVAQRRPGAPQPLLEAPSTAPATQTGAAGQRRPGAPQPLLKPSKYCACHADRTADQRRPGAPQPFLEALSTAPATQTGAADQRRPGAPQPFLEALSTAPATQTGAV